MEVKKITAVNGSSDDISINENPSQTPDYSQLSNLTIPLSSILPSSPAFCHSGNFQQVYQKELVYISKNATKVLSDKQRLS
ncbi:MAG: hypothetical protein MJZ16_13565, partial [Bacteroidales bacterium]|nr:hypothetical protein [Bacteroidales bacterium]